MKWIGSLEAVVMSLIFSGIYTQNPNINNGNMEQWKSDTLNIEPVYFQTPNFYNFLQYGTTSAFTVEKDVGCIGNASAKISIKKVGNDTIEGYLFQQVPYNNIPDSFSIYVKSSINNGDTAIVAVSENDLLNNQTPAYIGYIPIYFNIPSCTKLSTPITKIGSTADTLVFLVIWSSNSKKIPGSTIWVDSIVIYQGGSAISLPLNNGLENWTLKISNVPQNWISWSDIAADTNTIFQSTDAQQGNYSAMLIPKPLPLFGNPPDTASILIYGVSYSSIISGEVLLPFIGKPDTLAFYYKLSTNPPNSGGFYIHASKWNSASGNYLFKIDTLINLNPSTQWARYTFPLNLPSPTDTIGLAFIIFSNIINGNDYLKVDNVSFIYVTTGEKYIYYLTDDDNPLFYNNKKLFLKNNSENNFTNLYLYNSEGKEVIATPINNKNEIYINLPSGLYFYKLSGNKNNQKESIVGKIIVE